MTDVQFCRNNAAELAAGSCSMPRCQQSSVHERRMLQFSVVLLATSVSWGSGNIGWGGSG